MISGDLPRAKSLLAAQASSLGVNFATTLEFVRLGHAGIKAISANLYELPPLSIPAEFPSEVRQTLTEETITNLRIGYMIASADAAAIVFSHAILDDLATTCCRVCAIADPWAWEKMLRNKQVSLSDVKARSFEDMYADLLQTHVEKLDREPLKYRIGIIHERCPPPPSEGVTFPSIFEMTAEKYKFDWDRISAIDKLRQDILHRVALGTLKGSIETVIGDIAYVERSCYYLLWLVDQKYQTGLTREVGPSERPRR